MNKYLVAPLALAMAVSMATSVASAATDGTTSSNDVLYFSDTINGNTYNGVSELYRVNIDATTNEAQLTPLPGIGYGPGLVPFDHADAMAASPDGTKLYLIDDGPNANATYHHLGVYNIASATWNDLGLVSGLTFTTDQAATAPDGTLYIGDDNNNSLWTVDPSSVTATEVGKIVVYGQDGVTVVGVPDVSGADIAFAADGTGYLWSNYNNGSGAPKGLYQLSVPAAPGNIAATYLGVGAEPGLSGLAIRSNGFGDLIGSAQGDAMYSIDKTLGTILGTYPTYLDGSPYHLTYGDMTSGPLVLCTRTIGYWKNHSWNGAEITIDGVAVSQDGTDGAVDGEAILEEARGNNYSMLFAQLIAAKLNSNNATGLPSIDDAEAYIDTTWGTAWPDHVTDAIPKAQKHDASSLWEALDTFNNEYECQQ